MRNNHLWESTYLNVNGVARLHQRSRVRHRASLTARTVQKNTTRTSNFGVFVFVRVLCACVYFLIGNRFQKALTSAILFYSWKSVNMCTFIIFRYRYQSLCMYTTINLLVIHVSCQTLSMRIYAHTHTHTHSVSLSLTHTQICILSDTHVYICVCTCLYMCVHVYVCVCIDRDLKVHRPLKRTIQTWHSATQYNILEHTVAHCIKRVSPLSFHATQYNTLQHTAAHCSTSASPLSFQKGHGLEAWHTATQYDTLQHTGAHCNTRVSPLSFHEGKSLEAWHSATQYNALQHTTTQCITLEHTATHVWVLCLFIKEKPWGLTFCNTIQHTTTHNNTLQHTVAHYDTRVNPLSFHKGKLLPASHSSVFCEKSLFL